MHTYVFLATMTTGLKLFQVDPYWSNHIKPISSRWTMVRIGHGIYFHEKNTTNILGHLITGWTSQPHTLWFAGTVLWGTWRTTTDLGSFVLTHMWKYVRTMELVAHKHPLQEVIVSLGTFSNDDWGMFSMISGARYLLCMVPFKPCCLFGTCWDLTWFFFPDQIWSCCCFCNDIYLQSLQVLPENLEESQFCPVIATHEVHIVSHPIQLLQCLITSLTCLFLEL